ncbi:Gfo/Idh/MocA family oxidoreductase [Rathayibacter soli]|uniref:Gfo/Idh/MocA family oxidoreductase n=1 Tax=Rathayibacter soli TaxID=3144168 RepID=UPI0027E515F9|nr:Gfo/Idh/MocA family oxidoreductase [Glaciibacter superstes]
MHPHDIAALPPLIFGEPGEFREQVVSDILAGRKTGSTNLAVAYALKGERVPRVSELRALLDSTNRRVAVVRYTDVVRTSSADITEFLTLKEAASIEAWRTIHREYWATLVEDIRGFLGDAEWELRADEPAISTVFEVIEITERTPSVAFIGAGFHASSNLLPACVLGGIRIDAIATTDVNRSAAALARFGSDGVAYRDAAELLQNPAVRNVVIVAQPDDQAQLARQAIAAGKNVFVEKPLGRDGGEAAEIAAAAEQAGVRLAVGFMKRYAPAYQALKAELDDGSLGELHSFQLTFGCDSTAFCANEREFLTLAAIHVVDLVRYLFGEPAEVKALSNTAGNLVSMAVSLRFDSGVIGTLDLTGLPSFSSETELLRVVGRAGVAAVRNVAELAVHTADAGDVASWRVLTDATVTRVPAESAMSGVERDLYLRGFVGELQAFADSVADAVARPTSSSDGWDNARTMELCDRILAAAG